MNLNVLNDKRDIENIIVLKYFNLKSDGNDYIIYKNDNNSLINQIYVAKIEELNGEYQLKNVTDEKIISEIKSIAKEMLNEKL